MAPCDDGDGRILGVDRTLLTRILELLRDKYPLADKSNYFLERQGYAGINITITNQRDALSHLVTLLADRTLDHDGQLAQLHNAEEHLRRAIVEPYERAIDMKLSDILDLRDQYIESVVPLLGKASLAGAPTLERVDNKLRAAQSLKDKGRTAKARNKWDEEWENGIKCLLQAFECLEELERAIAEWVSKAEMEKRGSTGVWWGRIGAITGLVGLMAGVLIAAVW